MTMTLAPPANPLSVEIRGTDLHPEGPPSLVYGQSFTLLGIVYGGLTFDLIPGLPSTRS